MVLTNPSVRQASRHRLVGKQRVGLAQRAAWNMSIATQLAGSCLVNREGTQAVRA